MRLAFTRLHWAVHVSNVPIDDLDALGRVAGILDCPLPNFDALDEQPNQLRR